MLRHDTQYLAFNLYLMSGPPSIRWCCHLKPDRLPQVLHFGRRYQNTVTPIPIKRKKKNTFMTFQCYACRGFNF